MCYKQPCSTPLEILGQLQAPPTEYRVVDTRMPIDPVVSSLLGDPSNLDRSIQSGEQEAS